MLLPSERQCVDAAGEGLYRTFHRESIEAIIGDLRERHVSAVLVSVLCCADQPMLHVARLVREFPRVPAAALLTRFDEHVPQTVLSLGQCGVRSLIDVRTSSGWRELRNTLVVNRTADIERQALGQLALDLVGAPPDCWQFFESLFVAGQQVSTIRALARSLRVLPSTLMSRFFRAGLPAPKRYLAIARLTYAARVFENPGLSVANVANFLDYSSPQSFGRHIRTMIGLTAIEFRQRYDGEGMLQRFRDELILPYQSKLRTLRPLESNPRWLQRIPAEVE